jgi:hypothetical protein
MAFASGYRATSPARALAIQAREPTVEDILREPVELIDHDLDEVAGGNPFSFSTFIAPSFAIGAVFGDFSTANFGSFAGQVNTFGTNVA